MDDSTTGNGTLCRLNSNSILLDLNMLVIVFEYAVITITFMREI